MHESTLYANTALHNYLGQSAGMTKSKVYVMENTNNNVPNDETIAITIQLHYAWMNLICKHSTSELSWSISGDDYNEKHKLSLKNHRKVLILISRVKIHWKSTHICNKQMFIGCHNMAS